MIKIQTGWVYQKEGGSNIKDGVFFNQSKLMPHFVPVIHVSPDTKKRRLG